jgi:NAD(P)-dependent dehydrogenase (short-subunit alcohol dehydrogenase family)
MSQKVLITGTNSGFGRLSAIALARKGHTVFATMRDIAGRNRPAAEEMQRFAQNEGLKLHVVEMALTSDASVESAVKGVLAKAESLDVVVNNAGYGLIGLEETLTSAQLLEQFDVNVVGPHRVLRAVLPSMRAQRKGYLIHVSSTLGRMVFPVMGAYCASKAALESLADAYSYELRPLGIESTVLQPGAFPTEFSSRTNQGKEQERAQGYGPMANAMDQMGAAIQHMLKGPGAQDPRDVADALVQLVESAPGSRPERLVVDKLSPHGALGLNAAHREVQKSVLGAMGMGGSIG